MTNKELSPEEAYKALIDGKVIEKSCKSLKVVGGRLTFKVGGGVWIDPARPHEYLLNLTGYRLAGKKVKKEFKGWVNILPSGGALMYQTAGEAIEAVYGKHYRYKFVATAVEMTGEYEVWEDENE